MKTGGQQHGYTLIEVLLVTAVTLLIASASVVSFAPLMQQVSFEEGAGRFESLLRFARAEAANSGHKIQIQFEPTGSTNSTVTGKFKPLIVVEQDPFHSPGLFVSKPELSWMNDHVYDLVAIESVRSLDPPEPPSQERDLDSWVKETTVAADNSASPCITFYPDGSSDSAEFMLTPADQGDGRRMRIRLIGLTGEISRQSTVDSEEFEGNTEPLDDGFLIE